MPDTHLILHVKGTEAETTELPKEAVRAAISQGKLTHSQLIWSPGDNVWKQVRDLPELLPGEKLILHVKGTESETKELPKQAVRAAVSEGKLTHSQLIWSPADNAWKQVRELPDLLPSQKLAPSPSRKAVVSVAKTLNAIAPESPEDRASRGVAASAEKEAGKAKAADLAHSKKRFVVKEDDTFHPVKWLCIGLGIIILVLLVGNELLVDMPLRSNMAKTSCSDVMVYAHLGAFVQPNVIVIHIPSSTKITPENLTDVLVALAGSTPQNPMAHDLFERVAVTSEWTAQYSFSGYSWKELGDMQQESEADRKEFLLTQLGDAAGNSFMPASTLDEATKKAAREQVWKAFVAHFTAQR